LRSLIYVGNLADAIARIIEKQISGFEIFHVADEPPVSTPHLYQELMQNFGKSPRFINIPEPLLKTAATITGKAPDFQKIAGSLVVSSAKLRDTFEWKEPFSFEEGIKQTCEWYKFSRLVK